MADTVEYAPGAEAEDPNVTVSDVDAVPGGAAAAAVEDRPVKARRVDEVSIEGSSGDEAGRLGDEEADGWVQWDSDAGEGEEGVDEEADDDDDDDDGGSLSGIESIMDVDDDGGEVSEEDGYYSDDDLGEGEHELNDETLARIQRNDPDVTSLVVHDLSEDVNTAADRLGDSSHLKAVSVKGSYMDWADSATRPRLELLLSGVARNENLERLSLAECSIGDEYHPFLEGLSPLFEPGATLRSLQITGCNIPDAGVLLLADCLSRRRGCGSLERVVLDATAISDEVGQALINSLAGHDDLAELSLGDNELGSTSCSALKKLLSRPDSRLEKLNLENNQVDDQGIRFISEALAENTTLREVNLSFNCEVTDDGWRTFSGCLKNNSCGIEKLDLSSTSISDVGIAALGNALVENRSVKTLDLYDLNEDGVPQVAESGWHNFFACLGSGSAILERLDLRYGSIDEGGLLALADALGGNTTVKMLDLSHNTQVQPTGWKSFVSRLKVTGLGAVEELRLSGNHVGDEAMGDLADALVGNETLETLVLGGLVPMTDAGWDHLRRLLCDTTRGIDGIHASNHTLSNLGPDEDVPPGLQSLLVLNGSGSRKEAARKKILRYHFGDGTANVRDLIGLEAGLLPHAMSWMGGDEDGGAGHTLLYGMLRGLPSLLACKVSGTSDSGTRKRKRASCIHNCGS